MSKYIGNKTLIKGVFNAANRSVTAPNDRNLQIEKSD